MSRSDRLYEYSQVTSDMFPVAILREHKQNKVDAITKHFERQEAEIFKQAKEGLITRLEGMFKLLDELHTAMLKIDEVNMATTMEQLRDIDPRK